MWQKCFNIVGLIVSCAFIYAQCAPVKESKTYLIETIYLNRINQNYEQQMWNVSTIAKTCPDNFTFIDNKCYYVEQHVKQKYWTGAKRSCEALNAELTHIENAAEWANIKNYLIHANETLPSQTFLFVGRSAYLEMNVTKWYDNKLYDDNMLFHCIGITNNPNEHQMKLFNCNEPSYFICEIDPIETQAIYTVIQKPEQQAEQQSETQSINQNVPEQCQPDFVLIGDNCYYFSIDLENRFDAIDKCNDKSADLANMDSLEELHTLSQYLVNSGYRNMFWVKKKDELTGDCFQLKYFDEEYVMGNFDCIFETAYLCKTTAKNLTTTAATTTTNEPFESIKAVMTTRFSAEKLSAAAELMPSCTNNFVLLGNKCYYFGTIEKQNVANAQNACRNMQAQLTRVGDAQEMSNLNVYLMWLYYAETFYGEGFWIMADDGMAKGNSYPNEKMIYAHWAQNEPDDNKNCVQLYNTDGEYFMRKNHCSERANYICDKAPEVHNAGIGNTNELSSKADQLVQSACPEGFIKLDKKCYAIENLQMLDWFAAEGYCHSINAQLLSTEDAQELNTLAKHLISVGHFGDDGWRLAAFWTSGNDLSSEGEFYWQSTGKELAYTKWYDNEPNNYNNMENCVELRYFYGQYFMNDIKCAQKNFFICETNVLTNQLCAAA